MAANPNNSSPSSINKQGRPSAPRVRFASSVVTTADRLGQNQASLPTPSPSTFRQALDSNRPQIRRYQQPRLKNPLLESSTQTSFRYTSPCKRKKTILAIPSSIPDSLPTAESPTRKSLAFPSQQQPVLSPPETSSLLLLAESPPPHQVLSPRKSSFPEQQQQELRNSVARKSVSLVPLPFEQDPPDFPSRRSISRSSQSCQHVQDPTAANTPLNSEEYQQQQQHMPDSWNSFSPDSQLYQEELPAFPSSFSPDSQACQHPEELHDHYYAVRDNSYLDPEQYQEDQHDSAESPDSQSYEHDLQDSPSRKSFFSGSQPFQQEMQDPAFRTSISPTSRRSMYPYHQQLPVSEEMDVSPDLRQQSSASRMSISPSASSTVARKMSISPRKTEISPSRKSLHLQLQQQPQQQQSSPKKSVIEQLEPLFDPQQYQPKATDSVVRDNGFPDSRQSMHYTSSQKPSVQMSFSPRETQAQVLPAGTDDMSSEMEDDDTFPSPRMSMSPELMQEPRKSSVGPLQAQPSSTVFVARMKSMSPRQTQIQQAPASSLSVARMKSISPAQTEFRQSSLLPIQTQASSPRKLSQPQLQQQFSPRKSLAQVSQLDSQQYEQQAPSSAFGNNTAADRALSMNADVNQALTEQMSISPRTQQQSASRTSISPRLSGVQQTPAAMDMSPEMQQNAYAYPRMSISQRQQQGQQSPGQVQVPTQEFSPLPSQMASSPGEKQTEAIQLGRMQSSMKRPLNISPRQSVAPELAASGQSQAQQASSPRRMQSGVQKSVSMPPEQTHTASIGKTKSIANRLMSISPEQITISPRTSIDRSVSVSPSETVTAQVTSPSQMQNQFSPQRMQSNVDMSRSTSPRKTQIQQAISPEEIQRSTSRAMSISPRQTQVQQQLDLPSHLPSSMQTSMSISPRKTQLQQQPESLSRVQSTMQRSSSISPTQINMEQKEVAGLNSSSSTTATLQGLQSSSPPQLNQYLSAAVPRVSVIANTYGSEIRQPRPDAKQMQYVRNNTTRATFSASPSRRTHVDYHLAVTDVVLRSMAAIASAVAFCVMVTNTVLINGEQFSYSMIPGFRYVAGTSATAFLITIIQLGAMVTRKLKSQDIAIQAKPSISWLAFTMIVDQTLAYLLLSAGSVGVGALVYIPSICSSVAISHAAYCSRSTVSVVLALVACIVFVMSAILSSFKFYKKTVGSM